MERPGQDHDVSDQQWHGQRGLLSSCIEKYALGRSSRVATTLPYASILIEMVTGTAERDVFNRQLCLITRLDMEENGLVVSFDRREVV